jgi:hypothetical protein
MVAALLYSPISYRLSAFLSRRWALQPARDAVTKAIVRYLRTRFAFKLWVLFLEKYKEKKKKCKSFSYSNKML